MKVLELYSGIGGMHWALLESGIQGEVLMSIDINPIANSIYVHNFPQINLLNRNIQGLIPNRINSLGIDAILMSPPCQPFTRNGLQRDVGDDRTDSFKYVLEMLPQLGNVDKILLENVKGFEESKMRDLFVETLRNCGFHFREFMLSPTQFGVPNSRSRYYCVARRKPWKNETNVVEYSLDNANLTECYPLSHILEKDELEQYKLSDKVLCKYLNLLDIRHSDSKNTCCFTKAYSRFVEGTGSVYTPKTQDFTRNVLDTLNKLNRDSVEYMELVKELELRFFTPREVARLMCFPDQFDFPAEIKDRQKYAVLGNSLNVKVVAQLIKLLHS